MAISEQSLQKAREIPAGLSYQEFLDWLDEDTRAEWVDGEIIVVSPASDPHQDLSDFLTTVLRTFLEEAGLGIVRSAPFQMKTGENLPGREPDLLYLAEEHQHRLEKTFLNGPADLVIEIISPDSRERDWDDKFQEYKAGGVKEYWLIDPELEQASFCVLEDGQYKERESEAGIYESPLLPGFRLRIAWLWQDPLPRVLDVLRELQVIE